MPDLLGEVTGGHSRWLRLAQIWISKYYSQSDQWDWEYRGVNIFLELFMVALISERNSFLWRAEGKLTGFLLGLCDFAYVNIRSSCRETVNPKLNGNFYPRANFTWGTLQAEDRLPGALPRFKHSVNNFATPQNAVKTVIKSKKLKKFATQIDLQLSNFTNAKCHKPPTNLLPAFNNIPLLQYASTIFKDQLEPRATPPQKPRNSCPRISLKG